MTKLTLRIQRKIRRNLGHNPRIYFTKEQEHQYKKLLVKIDTLKKQCIRCDIKMEKGSMCDKLPDIEPGTICMICHAEIPHFCEDRKGMTIPLMAASSSLVEHSPIHAGLSDEAGIQYKEEKVHGADISSHVNSSKWI